jgi:hypothetical protein
MTTILIAFGMIFFCSTTIPHWALDHGENHSTYRLPFLGAAFGTGHGKRLTLQKETEITCRRPMRTKTPRISPGRWQGRAHPTGQPSDGGCACG